MIMRGKKSKKKSLVKEILKIRILRKVARILRKLISRTIIGVVLLIGYAHRESIFTAIKGRISPKWLKRTDA